MFTVMSFDTDNNDDRSFLLEDEMDLAGDLFAIYFVVWGKFALFLFFIQFRYLITILFLIKSFKRVLTL